MDRFITSFLEEFGEPEHPNIPTQEYINSYRGKLPNTLLDYWAELGFCRFMGGLFWITNPKEYEELLEQWIQNSPLKSINEKIYVIARSGFGDLYLWSEGLGHTYRINALNGWIIESEEQDSDIEKELQLFFASQSPYTVDLEDEETDEEMFENIVAKYGALETGEAFGFSPILLAGGNAIENNLQKVDLSAHLDIILQFGDPKLITINDLKNMAFS